MIKINLNPLSFIQMIGLRVEKMALFNPVILIFGKEVDAKEKERICQECVKKMFGTKEIIRIDCSSFERTSLDKLMGSPLIDRSPPPYVRTK